ncbi:MAG: TetR family transcriptional regulator [Anaerolineales bacterium]|jgi:TetR/AcrR family acrAB operon transcriptional repressor
MRRTKEEAAQTRQDLLEAALTIFSQQGYAAARLEDIAEAAGVTRGAIYHHFGSKADLFQALVEDASALGSNVVQNAIAEGGTFVEITRRVLVRTMHLLEDNRRFREVMALTLFKTGGSPELDAFTQQRHEQARTQVEQIAGFFRSGIEQGALRSDLAPNTAARAFLAYQNGLALLWLSNPEAFSIKGEAEELAGVLLNGIVSP